MSKRTTEEAADHFNLREHVRKLFDEENYSKENAAASLVKCRDPVVNEALRLLGIDQAVRTFQTSERHAAESKDPPVSEQAREPFRGSRIAMDPEAIKARADMRIARRLFWDRHTLFGGNTLLGDANRKDLAVSAQEFGKYEQGNRNMRKFHEDIADRLSNDKKVVRDSMSIEVVLERAKVHHVIEA